ncbi:MAG TPA: nuclear transport factor 2 family protein [Burkholderiaceae bacterium]
MKPAKPTVAAALAGDADATEAAFYAALRQGDAARIMACWSDEDEIVCIHPGGPRLVGMAAIRAAFEAMTGQGGLQLQPRSVCKVQALASAVHTIIEHVALHRPDGGTPQEVYVIATNVYHHTPQGWRLVARHASAGGPDEARQAETVVPRLLH